MKNRFVAGILMFSLLCFATGCSCGTTEDPNNNSNVNDVTEGNDTMNDDYNNGVVDDLGEDIGQGVEDVGDAIGEGVKDITGNGTDNTNNGNVNDNNANDNNTNSNTNGTTNARNTNR